MRRKVLPQVVDKIGLLQLACANVDADRNIQSYRLPVLNLTQRCRDHPVTDIDGQGVIFDHRQKNGRWQQTA